MTKADVVAALRKPRCLRNQNGYGTHNTQTFHNAQWSRHRCANASKHGPKNKTKRPHTYGQTHKTRTEPKDQNAPVPKKCDHQNAQNESRNANDGHEAKKKKNRDIMLSLFYAFTAPVSPSRSPSPSRWMCVCTCARTLVHKNISTQQKVT